ncbi:MAG: hypothetical protein HFJ42_02560 [Clostridia bacterium]|nr:hypothetical protein [Clostridia bacterium]
MGQPVEWVIKVLDDSRRKSIEYENRCWLMKNVHDLNVHVCVENCLCSVFGIVRSFDKEGTLLIQDGKDIGFSFNPCKEALSLVKDNNGYRVFLYSPKEV